MTPEIFALLLQIMIKFGPEVARHVREMVTKTDVSDADWDKLFALAEKPFQEYKPPQ